MGGFAYRTGRQIRALPHTLGEFASTLKTGAEEVIEAPYNFGLEMGEELGRGFRGEPSAIPALEPEDPSAPPLTAASAPLPPGEADRRARSAAQREAAQENQRAIAEQAAVSAAMERATTDKFAAGDAAARAQILSGGGANFFDTSAPPVDPWNPRGEALSMADALSDQRARDVIEGRHQERLQEIDVAEEQNDPTLRAIKAAGATRELEKLLPPPDPRALYDRTVKNEQGGEEFLPGRIAEFQTGSPGVKGYANRPRPIEVPIGEREVMARYEQDRARLEQDLAKGVIPPQEADRLREEVLRNFLVHMGTATGKDYSRYLPRPMTEADLMQQQQLSARQPGQVG